MEIGAKQLGAGCPTGPAMPPGRWFGLGGTGASTYAPDFQSVLPVYRERHGGRGSVSRSISKGVPDAGELPFGTRRICHLDDERNQEPADRSLPSNETGPDYGFAGRCHAGGGEQGIVRSASRRAGTAPGTERAGADSTYETLARIARGGYIARFAAAGLCGNSAQPGSTGRNCKIAHQPRTYRTGTNFATNGSKAIMNKQGLRMAGVRQTGDLRKLVGGWL